jgi:hypothetical protein
MEKANTVSSRNSNFTSGGRISEYSVIFHTVPSMYSTEKLLPTTFNEGRELSDRTLLLFSHYSIRENLLPPAVSQTTNLPACRLIITSTTMALFLYSIMQKTSF